MAISLVGLLAGAASAQDAEGAEPGLDLIIEFACREDGSADVQFDVVNLTEQALSVTLQAFGPVTIADDHVVAGRDRIVITEVARVDGVVHASVFAEGGPTAFADRLVDCRPNSALNDLLSNAIEVERTPLRTLLNAHRPDLDAINGVAGIEVGFLGSGCSHRSGDIWYSFVATAETTGFTGSDDQNLAYFRSPLASPASVADLELIGCAQPEDGSSFATTPGERIYVAVSRDFWQRVYVTDPDWTVARVDCAADGGYVSVEAGSHEGGRLSSFVAELDAGGAIYSEVANFGRVTFARMPDGIYELTITEPESGADFVEPEELVVDCRTLAPNDRVGGAAAIASDPVALHPDQVVTRDGEEGLSCFGGPASWYRAVPGVTSVLLGGGQDFAVFSGGEDAASVADLDEIACFEQVQGLASTTLASVDVTNPYYIAVSADAGTHPWRLVGEFALVAQSTCSADETSVVVTQVVNASPESREFTVEFRGAEQSGVAEPMSTTDLVTEGVADGDYLLVLRDGAGRFVGNAPLTVDCAEDAIPLRPPNDMIGSATRIFFESLPTRIYDGSGVGAPTLEPGEIGECYAGGTRWFVINAPGVALSVLGRDEQVVAVHRSSSRRPESMAELEVIACGEESVRNIETVPGETLLIALSAYSLGDVWVVADEYAYIDPEPDSCGAGNVTSLVVGNDSATASIYRAVARDSAGSVVWTQDFDLAGGANSGARLDEVLGDGLFEITVSEPATGHLLLAPSEVRIACDGLDISVRTEAMLQGSPDPVAFLEFADGPVPGAEWRVVNRPDVDLVVTDFGSVLVYADPSLVGTQTVHVQALVGGDVVAEANFDITLVGFDPRDVLDELDLPFGLHSTLGAAVDAIDINHLPWRSDNGHWAATGLPPGVTLRHDFNMMWFEGAATEPGVYSVRICNYFTGGPPRCATVLETEWRVAALSAEVTHHVSCLGGSGRVDTTIVNPSPPEDRAAYELRFEGLSPRGRLVDGGDWARLPITGRADGGYLVRVVRDGVEVSSQTVVVDCDDSPTVSEDEVTVIVACRDGLGYVLFELVNPTAVRRGYVVIFEGVANRSQTAMPHAQAVRAVTGRPPGTYDVAVRVGSTVVYEQAVVVHCV